MPSAGRSPSVAPTRLPLVVLVTLLTGLGALVAGAPAAAEPSPWPAAPDRTERWDWPVEGPLGPFGPPPEVLRGFDPPERPWLPGHRGVDLAADAGASVRAAGTGTVVFAGPLAGRGVVSIDHADGLRTTYEPVAAEVVVGEQVTLGQPIGLLEPLTAHCARACLHWGLRRGEDYLDPLGLVRRLPPVLLPYGPPIPLAPGVPPAGWPFATPPGPSGR